MSSDLLLRGGTLVTTHNSWERDIRVTDGKIAEIGSELETAGRVIDVSGQIVMPGGIDTHVHHAHPIKHLGIETADDFHTGTVAAACGGVTTIIDFALQQKGDTLANTLDSRLPDVEGKAVIDYGLHLLVTDARADCLHEIPELIDSGFPSYKLMMTYEGKRLNDVDLLRVFEAVSKSGGMCYVHCENDAAINHLIDKHLMRGESGPCYHAQSRPAQVEAEATNRAICLAEVANAPICIAHVTNMDVVNHIRAARSRGLPVVAETCPQYITLTDDVYDPSHGLEAAKFVCSPPIRDEAHRDALWYALYSGDLQQVSSDHAPFRYADQKTLGRDNFTRIPNGLPGVETRLPLVFTNGVKAGTFSVNRFVELVSTNPAKIFGMYPQKGSLEIGADADLVVMDPDREVEIDHETLHSSVDYSPYQGMRVVGFPTWTISRGEIIVENGEPKAERGRGQLVKRTRIDPGALP